MSRVIRVVRARRRSLAGLALLLLLALAVFMARSRPPRAAEPDLVRSDTIADPSAVGLCARNRESGAVEGRIEALVELEGSDRPHYRVRHLTNPGAVHIMNPAAVQVVKCETGAA
jgi:hypothetical protein